LAVIGIDILSEWESSSMPMSYLPRHQVSCDRRVRKTLHPVRGNMIAALQMLAVATALPPQNLLYPLSFRIFHDASRE
jgi:hypothetical protein